MRWPSLLLLFAALASGCMQELSPASGCAVDGDCAAAEVCVDGRCKGDGAQAVVCTVASEIESCGVGSYCDASGLCAELPSCADGAPCPEGLACNDATGACGREPACEDCCTAASCDDGRWCNGVEICSPSSGACAAGEAPCVGASPVCDEATRACLCGDDADCAAPETCQDGSCSCTRDCAGKQCGDDGCGGSCGSCAAGEVCNDGLCACVPDCLGRECGSDGCDGSCGTCTGADTCDDGTCVCVPDCVERQCGDDGCGGSCGTCATGTCSASGKCNCVPECTDKECGDDGCGGSCGTCATGTCGSAGTCDCTPDCTGRECGNDGCGGSCGGCGPHQLCLTSGQCENTGVVCDVLDDTITLDEYQSRTGFLTAGFDEQYEWDLRPHRYLDNYPLVVPANTSVVIDLVSADFDATLYVYDVAGGACSLVADDDDSGEGLNASLAVTLGSGSYHVVTTTYGELDTGEYAIATSTDLCGLTVTQAAYDKCRGPVLTNSCSNNPCLGSAQEFCCVTEACRSGYNTGDELKVLTSSICP